MKVCEVCGALQSASDTDKRLTMHLEGKLHTGYLKIRKKLAELKNKRASERRGQLKRQQADNSAPPLVAEEEQVERKSNQKGTWRLYGTSSWLGEAIAADVVEFERCCDFVSLFE